jgi:hypothetical protein
MARYVFSQMLERAILRHDGSEGVTSVKIEGLFIPRLTVWSIVASAMF